MTSVSPKGVGAWMAVMGFIWAAVLHFSDPSRPVLAALAVASIGLLVITLVDSDDDQDDGPPTADDLER